MAVSKRKAQTVASSSEDELEGDTDSPPPNKRHSKPTAKRGESDKENLDKVQAAFICAKKKLEQLQKVSKRDAQKRKQLTTESDAELPESEDEDPPPGFFSSAIRALTPLDQDSISPRRSNRQEVESRAASPAVIQTSLTVRPSGSSPAPPDNCSSAVVAVKLVAGLKLTDSPAISDFADANVQNLLGLATHHYEAQIITKGAFPSSSVQTQCVRMCWDIVQKEDGKIAEDGTILRYELTMHMLRLVKARGSHVCGIFIDAARNAVKEQFGFIDGKGARKFMKNMGIVSSLMNDATGP
ncbi:hypothetical protein H0H92_005819 [Tricholoma furcatifolium]|nr:hypothetical protein H0H92_005819 [Tricholoma furcatifolium]